MPAPAWEGCQGAEAALVSIGTTVPPHTVKINFPPAPHSFSEPALLTPNPTGGQPTHLSTSGGFPCEKANARKNHPAYSFGLYGAPPFCCAKMVRGMSVQGLYLSYPVGPSPSHTFAEIHFGCRSDCGSGQCRRLGPALTPMVLEKELSSRRMPPPPPPRDQQVNPHWGNSKFTTRKYPFTLC